MKNTKENSFTKKTQMIITKEELTHLINSWSLNRDKNSEALKFKRRRIDYLKKRLNKNVETDNGTPSGEFNLTLFRSEIDCLYIYWIKQSFYDFKESYASRRMRHFKSKVGVYADMLYTGVAKKLWQADIEHSKSDMDDTDFPEEDFDLYRGR